MATVVLVLWWIQLARFDSSLSVFWDLPNSLLQAPVARCLRFILLATLAFGPCHAGPCGYLVEMVPTRGWVISELDWESEF